MDKEKEMWIVCSVILVICFIGIFSLSMTSYTVKESLVEEDMVIALDSLLEAEKNVMELKKSNLSSYYVGDRLLEAKRAFLGSDYQFLVREFKKLQDKGRYDYSQLLLEDFSKIGQKEEVNYSKTIELTNLIKKGRGKALDLRDKINLLENKEKKARKDGVNTRKSLELLKQAKTSFTEERYEETEDLVVKAEDELNKASREYLKLIRLSRSFLEKYWWQVILIMMVLTISSILIAKKIRILKAKAKLKDYRIEIKTLKELMKKAQIERFKTAKLSASMYKIKMDKYKSKLNKIRAEIPVLEAIAKIKRKIEKVKKRKRGIITIRK